VRSDDLQRWRPWTVPLALIALSTPARDARAQGCEASSREGQRLMNGGTRLLEAEQLFARCAAVECVRGDVQRDCLGWLEDVRTRIPSVVFDVRDGEKRPLTDVSVTIDGAAVPYVAGTSVRTNPGQHAFAFSRPGMVDVTRSEVVLVGHKDTLIEVTMIEEPRTAPAPAAPAPAAPAVRPALPPPAPDVVPTASGASTVRLLGYGAIGAGAIGLAVGGVFGLKAIASRNDAGCDSNNECTAGPLHDARSFAATSTIAFAAGAVLVAGGVALLVFGPATGGTQRAAPVRLVPMLGLRTPALGLQGAW
jgi:hypothetical protein